MDAGSGEIYRGEPSIFKVQAAEKIYLSFRLVSTDPGGHSSRPGPNNAIYALTGALERLAAHRFPIHVSEIVRLYFRRSAPLHPGAIGSDMLATASQHAEATLNCRLLPGQVPEALESTLTDIIANPRVTLTRINQPIASPPSPVSEEILSTLEPLVEEMWPGVPLLPTLSAGATDGLYLRNAGIPVYGVSALFRDPANARAHGLNERVDIACLHQAREFWYRMLVALSSPP